MVDRLSMPAFVFNPHGNVPTWVAIYTDCRIERPSMPACVFILCDVSGWVAV